MMDNATFYFMRFIQFVESPKVTQNTVSISVKTRRLFIREGKLEDKCYIFLQDMPDNFYYFRFSNWQSPVPLNERDFSGQKI